MSGSGGGGGGGTSEPMDCESYVEITYLNSPVPKVLATLKVGDSLKVELRKQGAKKIVLALKGGLEAGSLTPKELSTLVACLQKGIKYAAEITELKGGRCQVLIKKV